MYKKFQLPPTSPSGFLGKKYTFSQYYPLKYSTPFAKNQKSSGWFKKCMCINFVLLKSLMALISIACAIVQCRQTHCALVGIFLWYSNSNWVNFNWRHFLAALLWLRIHNLDRFPKSPTTISNIPAATWPRHHSPFFGSSGHGRSLAWELERDLPRSL